MTHSVSDVMMIVNCLLVLALNDVSTNMGTTSGDELERAVLIKYHDFIPLLKAHYATQFCLRIKQVAII